MCGRCPAEAEGRIDGEPFYFRARGQRWSLSIGGDNLIGKPQGYFEEPRGAAPFALGWIEECKALQLIAARAACYRESRLGAAARPNNRS